MKFAYIPAGDYKPGQKIQAHGGTVRLVQHPRQGSQNWIAETEAGRQLLCIVTDAGPIAGIPE